MVFLGTLLTQSQIAEHIGANVSCVVSEALKLLFKRDDLAFNYGLLAIVRSLSWLSTTNRAESRSVRLQAEVTCPPT